MSKQTYRTKQLALALKSKKDKRVRFMFKEFKNHFKKTGAWPLSYEHYLLESGVRAQTFNALLELSGLKIKYEKSSLSLVIILDKK